MGNENIHIFIQPQNSLSLHAEVINLEDETASQSVGGWNWDEMEVKSGLKVLECHEILLWFSFSLIV